MPELPQRIADSIKFTGSDNETFQYIEKIIKAKYLALQVLKHYGFKYSLNSSPVIISKPYAKCSAGDGTVSYARLFKHNGKEKKDTVGILFDSSPNIKNVSSNNYNIIEIDGSEIRVFYGAPNEVDINPGQQTIDFVLSVMQEIFESIKSKDQKKELVRRSNIARQKSQLSRSANAKRALTNYSPVIAMVGFTALVVGGFIVSAPERPEITDNPTVVSIGDTAKPAFSPQLYDDRGYLDEESILDLPTDGSSGGGLFGSADNIQPGSIREFIIHPKDDNSRCVNAGFKYEEPKLDTKLHIWTDAVNEQGVPQDDKLEFTFNTDGIGACWLGELSDDDQYRLVVEWPETAP